jgi:heavy metal efflux system protein
VGFIALFGIALPNGMVLVTYLNQLLQEGIPMNEACVRGACLRLRPVLMTASAAGLGLVPMVLSSGTGSEVQCPLATVVIGGLVTSTILTLLVISALYRWFALDLSRGTPIIKAEERAVDERHHDLYQTAHADSSNIRSRFDRGTDQDVPR